MHHDIIRETVNGIASSASCAGERVGGGWAEKQIAAQCPTQSTNIRICLEKIKDTLIKSANLKSCKACEHTLAPPQTASPIQRTVAEQFFQTTIHNLVPKTLAFDDRLAQFLQFSFELLHLAPAITLLEFENLGQPLP